MGACFACGSELKLLEGRRAVCTLKSCPGGGLFYKCGYCGQFSFAVSPDKMFCYNPDCRMYKIKRSACPQCNKISVIEWKDQKICINRTCPSNTKRVEQCFFCGNKSLLVGAGASFCTKGDCEHILEEMAECHFCKKMSHSLLTSRCENPGCEMYGVEIGECQACGQRTFVNDASRADNGSCLNGDCPLSAAAPAASPDMTLADLSAFKPEDLGAAGGGEEAPPPEMQGTKIEDPLPSSMQRTLIEEPAAGPEADPVAAEEDSERTLLDEGGPKSQMQVDATLADVGLADAAAGAIDETLSPVTEEAPPAEPIMPSEEIAGEDLERFREFGSAAAETTASRSSLIDAFEFVQECILGTGEDSFPMCLVIGVSGAGKTTYLTMLGDILSQREFKYYFPYKNLSVKRLSVPEILAERTKQGLPTFPPEKIPMLRARVRDLVFDYSGDLFGKSLGRMLWPESTAPEEEGGDIWTYFLVSDIRRYRKTLAKIVTLETSGEDYEAVMKTIVEYDPKSAVSNPLQKVLHELMSNAEGFIVLVSPDAARNDDLFASFFMVLRDALEPRAMNVVASEVRERLIAMQTAGEDMGGADFGKKVGDMLREKELKRRREAEKEEKHREVLARLKRVVSMFTEGRATVGDVQRSDEGPYLKKMHDLACELFPEAVKRVQEMVEKGGIEKKGAVESYYVGLFQQLIKRVDLVIDRLEEEEKREKPGTKGDATMKDVPEEVFERMMSKIREQYKLRPEFSVAPDVQLIEDLEVTRFKRLKHIAVVVTKADMYPIVYPPEDYPTRKLQKTNIFLREVEDYLKLCGGEVRYYNTSATGYSMLRDIRHYPGKENTLTPINVIEPIFEMLAEYL